MVGALVLSLGLSGCQRTSAPTPVSTPDLARVVSLTPSLTELLFALDAGNQVVGVTSNDHYPPQVESLPEVGDIQLDYEKLLALHPDLVVYDPAINQAQIQRLQQLGLHLEPLPTQSLKRMLDAIRTLGGQLKREKQAANLVASLEGSLRQAEQRSAKLARHPQAWVEIWHDPLVGAGGQTYVSEIVEKAGFRNVLGARRGYPQHTLEELMRLDPEVLILTHPIAAELKNRPGWSQLKSIRRGAVLEVPEDWLVRPGPRLSQALQHMQDWLERYLQSGD